jgi:protein O-GlcNAc transferase
VPHAYLRLSFLLQAVELGLDSARREALRAALLARRATCPLFDTRRWVRDFERVLSRMWDIHCEGGGARDFEVRPDEDRG